MKSKMIGNKNTVFNSSGRRLSLSPLIFSRSKQKSGIGRCRFHRNHFIAQSLSFRRFSFTWTELHDSEFEFSGIGLHFLSYLEDGGAEGNHGADRHLQEPRFLVILFFLIV